MKKYAILFTFLFYTVVLHAQYSHMYYHRVGDTIEQTPNNAFLNWWDWNGERNAKPIITSISRKVLLQKNYTEVPIKIIGLAAVIQSNLIVYDNSKPLDFVVQEYLYLYDANENEFIKLAEVPWDTTDPHRQLHITYRSSNPYDPNEWTNCCGDITSEATIPLYEYYFPTPFIVRDSFYVGCSNFSLEQENHTLSAWGHFYGFAATTFGNCPSTTCHFPQTTYKKMETGSTTWEYLSTLDDLTGGYERLLVYPIIEVDTTVPPADMCPNVIEGFAVTQMADSCLVATWDAFPNTSEVQIIYGPITVAQTEWDTISIFSGNVFYLCDLDSAAEYYGFRARAICESAGDTLEWSALEWIPVESSASIAAEPPQSRLGRQVAISPNPVRGMLHLSSSATLLRVEIYNSVGILTYSEPTSGHMADIDFGNMPEGTYIAVVTTLNGSTAKRFTLVSGR